MLVLLGAIGTGTAVKDKSRAAPRRPRLSTKRPRRLPPRPCQSRPAPPTEAPAPTTAIPNLAPTASVPAAGLPAKPDAATRQAYLDALNAVGPRIIKPDKEDQAVSRGINQCSSNQDDRGRTKLATLALDRFTVTTRLSNIATSETGKAIVKAVRTHLCPTSDPPSPPLRHD
ncbi:hypothetical protein [Streptomyces sp. NPDC058664]|uniref:hypothetical protein n=1 Tax=unclassified Streptomyces TaxID=2593676 RepID=UPI003661DA40